MIYNACLVIFSQSSIDEANMHFALCTFTHFKKKLYEFEINIL